MNQLPDDEKRIEIKHKPVRTLVSIKIDGKSYPLTKWNADVVAKYEATGDVSELDKLKDFVLDI